MQGNHEHIILTSFTDHLNVNMLLNLLRQNDISADVKDPVINSMIPSIESYDILVPKQSEARAREILIEYKELHGIKDAESSMDLGKVFLIIVMIILLYLAVIGGMQLF